MSDDDLFDDNASDYGVGAQLVDGVPDDALDESSDDSDVDDETGAVAEDLVLEEDPATDIFNEADEPLNEPLYEVEITERQRLTLQWKTQVKRVMNSGKATSTTAAGVQKRYDVTAGIKRRAVVLRDTKKQDRET